MPATPAALAEPGDFPETRMAQLRPDQLESRLGGDLAPIYVVTGDEPQQHTEVSDRIRAAARAQGFTVREVLDAGSDFDWNRLTEAGASLSLFGDRRLLDLRLASGKPGRDGGAVLKAWAQDPAADTLLLVSLPQLDRQARQAAWFKALDGAGVVVSVRMPERDRLGPWIRQRMRARGLAPDAGAVELLAERVEGNLVAAAQEIDKLVLLRGGGPVDAEAVAAAVADSARFSAFDIGAAVLDGEPGRVARIIAGLRAEGAAPPLLLWALHRELHQLATVAARTAGGESPAAAMAAVGVWQSRQQRVGSALGRHGAAEWARLLARCARLDRLAKGAERGSFWEELVELALRAAGAPIVESGASFGVARPAPGPVDG